MVSLDGNRTIGCFETLETSTCCNLGSSWSTYGVLLEYFLCWILRNVNVHDTENILPVLVLLFFFFPPSLNSFNSLNSLNFLNFLMSLTQMS
jgi:hypothetical protein